MGEGEGGKVRGVGNEGKEGGKESGGKRKGMGDGGKEMKRMRKENGREGKGRMALFNLAFCTSVSCPFYVNLFLCLSLSP